MCYGIRELIGKKTRESNSIQRTGSPEMSEHPKIETMLRAWLKKRVPKGKLHETRRKGQWRRYKWHCRGGGRGFFPPPPGRQVDI